MRKETDYGSQKLHFVLKKQGFNVAQRQIQKILDETLQEFVKWYNEERIHHALDYKTPEEVYRENL